MISRTKARQADVGELPQSVCIRSEMQEQFVCRLIIVAIGDQ